MCAVFHECLAESIIYATHKLCIPNNMQGVLKPAHISKIDNFSTSRIFMILATKYVSENLGAGWSWFPGIWCNSLGNRVAFLIKNSDITWHLNPWTNPLLSGDANPNLKAVFVGLVSESTCHVIYSTCFIPRVVMAMHVVQSHPALGYSVDKFTPSCWRCVK